MKTNIRMLNKHLKSLAAPSLTLVLLSCFLLYQLSISRARRLPNKELVRDLVTITKRDDIDWKMAAIGGTAALFLGLLVASSWILKTFCSETLLAAAGLVPLAGEAGLGVCVGVGALWAVSTFIVGAAGTAGWVYDSGSATENAKRDLYSYATILNGTEVYGHYHPDLQEWFSDLAQLHAPTTHHLIWHASKFSNSSDPFDAGVHSFISETKFGNVSVVADKGSLPLALQVHESCHTENICSAADFQLQKRDVSDGNFVSYTDWGTNGGYDEDYKEWNYEYLVSHDYASFVGESVIEQIDGCTDWECYPIQNKFCLSLGYSQTRTSESVAVGEIYENAYGGVDGQCYNG